MIQLDETSIIAVGTILYGYCNGYFGDTYDDKRVEAMGADWIVAREIDSADNFPYFAEFDNGIMAHKDTIKKWLKEEGS